jgi:hypothetical protein
MDRRSFVQGAAAVAVRVTNMEFDGGRSYDSATVSVQLAEEQPGITSVLLTEHGDADYCIVEAFYWTALNGVRVLLHKEATTPLGKGTAAAADIALPVTSIVFLRIRELKLLTQSEFGDVPKASG